MVITRQKFNQRRFEEVQSKIDGLQSYDDMLEDKGDRDYHAMRDEP
jgi:hypothetical protein